MAKRSTGASNRRPLPVSDKFHQLDFNDRERVEFEAWTGAKPFDLQSFCIKLCECGWKISLSYSDYYSCYFGSLTDKRADSEYHEHTFSVRHADFDKLTRLLGYAHEKMLVDGQFRIPTRISDNSW